MWSHAKALLVTTTLNFNGEKINKSKNFEDVYDQNKKQFKVTTKQIGEIAQTASHDTA